MYYAPPKENPKNLESYDSSSAAKDGLSHYVQGTSCLEFWISLMIEQSMYYHKKAPEIWVSIYDSAHKDPINQRIV